MATAGLGKISDYVAKFDGSRPEDFAGFLDSFQLGVRALEIKKSKQYVVLVNALTGKARDVANKYVKKFIEENPEMEDGNADQKNALGQQLRDELITEVRSSPLVVGTKPRTTLLAKFNKITQGPAESVSEYHHRYNNTLENLAKQEPPVVLDDELVKLTAFIGHTSSTGLRPEFQYYVKLHGGDTVETALGAALQLESANAKPKATQVNTITGVQAAPTATPTFVDYEPRAPMPMQMPGSQQEQRPQWRGQRAWSNERANIRERPVRVPPKKVSFDKMTRRTAHVRAVNTY